MEIKESPAAIVATDQRYLNRQSTLNPLSHVVWRTTTNTTDIGAYITWMDLTVAVTNTKGETQKLLPGLTGYAEPGHIMAIMGPSGSGKSTLIDALAGRLATNAVETGTVLVNGRKRKLAYGSAGYVTQIENLVGNLTVRETIQYSANLRLPNSLSREEKEAIVDGTILEMGLQECERDLLGR